MNHGGSERQAQPIPQPQSVFTVFQFVLCTTNGNALQPATEAPSFNPRFFALTNAQQSGPNQTVQRILNAAKRLKIRTKSWVKYKKKKKTKGVQ